MQHNLPCKKSITLVDAIESSLLFIENNSYIARVLVFLKGQDTWNLEKWSLLQLWQEELGNLLFRYFIFSLYAVCFFSQQNFQNFSTTLYSLLLKLPLSVNMLFGPRTFAWCTRNTSISWFIWGYDKVLCFRRNE